MNNGINEELNKDELNTEGETDYVYKKVITTKENRRTWSVLSLIFAILSVVSFYFSWLSFIFGVIAVGFAILSRKNLGYFDRLTLAGIIIGIFGCVFSLAGIVFGEIFSFLF